MRKLTLICGIAAFLIPATAPAQSATQVTTGNLWDRTGGMMALGMSANGRYISGACNSWEGFLYDTETGKLSLTSEDIGSVPDDSGATQFVAVTDNGVAYGWDGNGGITLDADGNYSVFQPATKEFIMVMPQAVTPDGSVVVGYVAPTQVNSEPCYWENGEIHMLPYSNSQDAGFSVNQGCRALAVSSDASIITGILVNRANTFPLVYWKRQADGTYEYVAAFKNHYEDMRDIEGQMKPYYTTLLPKLFQPAALSPDGKTVAVYIAPVEDGKVAPDQLALYDIESDEITVVIPYNPSNLLYSEPEFTVVGLTDSGIMAGFSGSPYVGKPFVLYPENYGEALSPTEAFPGLDLLEEYEDFDSQWGGLYLFSAMAADASMICGYIEIDTDSPGFDTPYGFETFYINTGLGGSGVEGIRAENPGTEGPAQYYTIDGLKADASAKGLLIEKTSDGKTRKVIKR